MHVDSSIIMKCTDNNLSNACNLLSILLTTGSKADVSFLQQKGSRDKGMTNQLRTHCY